MNRKALPIAWAFTLLVAANHAIAESKTGSVIFIHPDGTSAATWAAARALYYGPDGMLNWDCLPAMALYRGHMADRITASSHGAGTTHACGLKVPTDSFGRAGAGETSTELVDAEGRSLSVAKQAIRRGVPVAIVQTGTSTEPGTACFLTSVESRSMHNEIAAQLIASGASIMLGGGEQFYLPEGVQGVYGPGSRKDGRNLIKEAKQAGYAVVRTKEELANLPDNAGRVLGLFARFHTFNDQTEEENRAANLPNFSPAAPTVAEMTAAALRFLNAQPSKPFLLIVEEEGADNFGNYNNASGMLEAMHRADDAIGVARDYINAHKETLLLTASDSDAGGMRMFGYTEGRPYPVPERLHPRDHNGAPQDGVTGTDGKAFWSAPDKTGRRFPFGIVWASRNDVSGGILVRAEGLNSDMVKGSFDNTDIAKIIRTTLFSDAPTATVKEKSTPKT